MAYEKASVVKGHHVYKSIWTPMTSSSSVESFHLHEPPSFVHLHERIFLLERLPHPPLMTLACIGDPAFIYYIQLCSHLACTGGPTFIRSRPLIEEIQ